MSWWGGDIFAGKELKSTSFNQIKTENNVNKSLSGRTFILMGRLYQICKLINVLIHVYDYTGKFKL